MTYKTFPPFFVRDREAELCRTILQAQNRLNPECHPNKEAFSPEQYRRVFQSYLSRHNVALDSNTVSSLLTRPHDVDRLAAASSKKGEKIRRFQTAVRLLGIDDVCHEDNRVLTTLQ